MSNRKLITTEEGVIILGIGLSVAIAGTVYSVEQDGGPVPHELTFIVHLNFWVTAIAAVLTGLMAVGGYLSSRKAVR